jgi:hypothetical protein
LLFFIPSHLLSVRLAEADNVRDVTSHRDDHGVQAFAKEREKA